MRFCKKLIAMAACLPFVLGAAACGASDRTAPGPDRGDNDDIVPVVPAPGNDDKDNDKDNGYDDLTGVIGKATLLRNAKASTPVYGAVSNASYVSVKASAARFASSLTGAAYANYGDKSRNMAVSPVSAYLALGLAAECAAGDTRSEILTALDISYDDLSAGYATMYDTLEREFLSNNGDVSGRIQLSNSIWMGTDSVKADCLDSLANAYYCYSYKADFRNDNRAANGAIKDFVKERTHGLIDKNFELNEDTIFALINALYLKDIWNEHGDDIFLTDTKYDFKCGDGKTLSTKLMMSGYTAGKTYEAEDFTSFVAYTYNNLAIRFMLPKAGKTNVFTADNFAKLNSLQYKTVDHQKKERYVTRCLFPKFDASFDKDISPDLKAMGINKLFSETACDLSSLTDADAYCNKIRHVTELKVDKKGIEGAAVTVIEMSGTAAPGFDDYETVYETFTVDGAFGYTISYNGVALFSGVTNAPGVI